MVCPLSERSYGGYRDLVSPYGAAGFVGTGSIENLGAVWHDVLRADGYVAAYVVLDPLGSWADGFNAADIFHQTTMFYLDLAPPLDVLRGQLAREHRRRLSRAEESPDEIVEDQDRLRRAFLDLYPTFADERAVSSVYRFASSTLEALAELPETWLVGVASGGAIEAVLLCWSTGHLAETFLSAASESGRRHARILSWNAIRHFKQCGVPQICLGAGVRDNDSIASFKAGFGGRSLPLRVLKQIVDRTGYEAACRAAGTSPDRAGYFPPYHRPS